ncbi:MAG: hypothetical protein AB8B59_00335 [Maribacter sp.]
MKKYIVLIVILLLALNGFCQTKITSEDLKLVIGNWEGSLTYIDYQSNKPFTMPANLIVTPGKNENSLVFQNEYPKEPKANNTDKIKITKKGELLNKNVVTSREALENGQLQIQTELEGKDAGKKAMIRYTYSVGSAIFIIRKEVKFEKATDWIKRSELKYVRKK